MGDHDQQRILVHALRSIGEGVCVTGDDAIIRFVNEPFSRIFGYTTDELVGRPIGMLRPPDFPPELARQIEVATAAGGFRGDITNLRKDGSRITVSLSTSRITDEKGVVVGLVGVVRDVTDRLAREEAERKRLKQLTAVSAVARHLASRLDARSVQRSAVEQIRETFDYHNVTLLLLDHQAGVLGWQEMAGAYVADAPREYTQEVGRGLIGTAAGRGESVLANDVRSDPRFINGFPDKVETRAELAVPIKQGDTVLGVLDIQETRPGAFDDVDVQTMETLADQIALHLHNARLFDRVQSELEERQRAEAALRDSEERYRDLVENASDLICTHDLDGVLLSVNEVAVRRLGYEVGDVIGRRLRNLLEPGARPAFDDYLDRIGRNGADRGVMTLLTRDGQRRYWEYDNTLRTEGVTEPVVRGFARDVTDRVAAQRALRHERDRAELYLDIAPVLFVALDTEGRVTMVNRRTANTLERPEEELVGADWFGEMTPPEDRDDLRVAFANLLAGDPSMLETWEYPVVTTSGEWRLIAWRRSLLSDASGAFVGALLAGEDVSDRRRLEEQLRHSQKMEAMGRLAGGVAHDFNNLLQAMLGTIQLLRLEDGGAEIAGAADELEEHVHRGASLARQLLLFAERGVSQPQRLDLNELVDDTLGLLRRLVRENINVDTAMCDRPLRVDGDRRQLEQVLTNLVVNSVDAMPEGGVLTLRTGETDGEVWIEVVDTGHGVDAAILGRIFEPFFTTKEADKGTGLGLAVVHGIVAQHGGRMEVDSEPGRGSTFRVLLPHRDSGVFQAGTEMPSVDSQPEPGEEERVLLVEDSDQIRSVFSRLLERLGYRAVAVDSAEAALELPGEPPFDLLISDVMLPGMPGTELAGALVERWPGLKVILMSGYAEADVLREEIAAGQVHFLQKPMDLKTFSRHVRLALEE